MPKTLSERITELSESVAGWFPVLDYRLEEAEQTAQSLERRVQILEAESAVHKHRSEQFQSEIGQTRGELKAALGVPNRLAGAYVNAEGDAV